MSAEPVAPPKQELLVEVTDATTALGAVSVTDVTAVPPAPSVTVTGTVPEPKPVAGGVV